MLTMGSGVGIGEVMGPSCTYIPEYFCAPTGTCCDVISDVLADTGVGIGGSRPKVCLVCSLSVAMW